MPIEAKRQPVNLDPTRVIEATREFLDRFRQNLSAGRDNKQEYKNPDAVKTGTDKIPLTPRVRRS